MELTIKVTKENKDKIFRLISELLDEDNISPMIQSIKHQSKDSIDYLSIPPEISDLPSGKVLNYETEEDQRLKLVGTWGQFNSFFPIKAALRILANVIIENENTFVNLDDYISKCIDVFNKTKISGKRLGKFRGFPRRKKDSAIGRFVWHFLTPTLEMGLICISSDERITTIPTSVNDWNKVTISITQQGYDFAILNNILFDQNNKEQVLSEEERKWLISYLKKINSKGFNEYTILYEVYSLLKQGITGQEDIWSWFENDSRFINYIKGWSTKIDDPEKLKIQIFNLSKTFSSSKIALLRELGIINNKRGDYSIIGGFNNN